MSKSERQWPQQSITILFRIRSCEGLEDGSGFAKTEAQERPRAMAPNAKSLRRVRGVRLMLSMVVMVNISIRCATSECNALRFRAQPIAELPVPPESLPGCAAPPDNPDVSAGLRCNVESLLRPSPAREADRPGFCAPMAGQVSGSDF